MVHVARVNCAGPCPESRVSRKSCRTELGRIDEIETTTRSASVRAMSMRLSARRGDCPSWHQRNGFVESPPAPEIFAQARNRATVFRSLKACSWRG